VIINLQAEGSLRIQTGGTVVLTEGSDPTAASRLKPDIFIRTAPAKTQLPNADFLISGPGEYEIKGVEIRGYHPFIYSIRAEDINLGLLSGAEGADNLEKIDLLFVPNNAALAKAIRQLNSPLVVCLNQSAKELEKELGVKAETAEKLTIKKKDIPQPNGLKLLCLKP